MGGGIARARSVPARVGVAIAAAGYVVVTTFLAWRLNLWRDEMYSLHSTSGSPRFAFDQAIHFELQPPLYFVVLSLWRSIEPSALFARLFSTACGAATVLATAALSRRILPRANPALAAAVVATHPLVIWAGSEIRVYALTILLSALLALVFVSVYLDEPRRRGRWGYVALAILALHTQYYLGLLLVGFGAALLARDGRRKFAPYAWDMAIVLASSAPLAWTAKHQLDAFRADVGAATFDAPVRLVWTRYEAYLFTLNDVIDRSRSDLSTLRVARWGYRAIVAAGLAGVFLAFKRRLRGSLRAPSWPLLVAIAVYAPGMFLLARTTGPLAVGARHTAGLLIPLLLAALSIPAAVGPRLCTYAAAFLIASNLPTLALLHLGPMAKECDCRRVADTLLTHETPREPILVFPSEEVMPMSEYYHDRNRLIPVPKPPDLRDWDQSTFRLVRTQEVEEALRRSGADASTLWVYTGTEAFAETVGRPMLERFLAGTYVEDERHEFANGELLRHFHRVEPSSDLAPRAP